MRVCLVGATHPCHNPRLIREADSLTSAGHEVRVVAPSFVVELREKDRMLVNGRRWHFDSVDYCPTGLGGKYRAYRTRGLRRAFAEAFALTNLRALAEKAYTPALEQLAQKAGAEKVDWIIAHAHAALPSAAKAAKAVNARLGFDCEDLLSQSPREARDIIKLIEQRYFPQCDYISVPSEAIRDALVQTYRIPPPLVLYNVFPKSLINGCPAPIHRKRATTIRLHWFGQVIGNGRGIEDAIAATRIIGKKVELHLRGRWANGYRQFVAELAARSDIKLVSYPPLDHDQLIASMTSFDIGLALECAEDPAYSKTVTNKVGSYLLAGLAIAATDTPGQREVLDQIPDSGFLYRSGNPQSLAEGISRWVDDPDALVHAQQAAWEAARSRFCWDFEKEKFFAALQN